MKKVNKLDFIKIKNFHLPKDTLGAVKASQTKRKYSQYIYLICILHIDVFKLLQINKKQDRLSNFRKYKKKLRALHRREHLNVQPAYE